MGRGNRSKNIASSASLRNNIKNAPKTIDDFKKGIIRGDYYHLHEIKDHDDEIFAERLMKYEEDKTTDEYDVDKNSEPYVEEDFQRIIELSENINDCLEGNYDFKLLVSSVAEKDFIGANLVLIQLLKNFDYHSADAKEVKTLLAKIIGKRNLQILYANNVINKEEKDYLAKNMSSMFTSGGRKEEDNLMAMTVAASLTENKNIINKIDFSNDDLSIKEAAEQIKANIDIPISDMMDKIMIGDDIEETAAAFEAAETMVRLSRALADEKILEMNRRWSNENGQAHRDMVGEDIIRAGVIIHDEKASLYDMSLGAHFHTKINRKGYNIKVGLTEIYSSSNILNEHISQTLIHELHHGCHKESYSAPKGIEGAVQTILVEGMVESRTRNLMLKNRLIPVQEVYNSEVALVETLFNEKEIHNLVNEGTKEIYDTTIQKYFKNTDKFIFRNKISKTLDIMYELQINKISKQEFSKQIKDIFEI